MKLKPLEFRLTDLMFQDAMDARTQAYTRFLHIGVFNPNKIPALECYAFVEMVKEVGEPLSERMLPVVEQKWKGVTLPAVTIPPLRERFLDVVAVQHDEPSKATICINPFIVDYQGYFKDFTIEGEFVLTTKLYPRNLPATESTIRVTLGKSISDARLA